MELITYKKYCWALIVALGAFTAACSSRVPSDWQTYQSAQMNLTVYHPSKWEVRESSKTFGFVCKDSVTQHTAMIGFGHLQDPFTKDILTSGKIFPKQSVHGTVEELVQLNGTKVVRSEGSMPGATDAWTRGYTFMQGDQVLNIFLLAYSSDLFKRMLPDFELMMRTLRLGDHVNE